MRLARSRPDGAPWWPPPTPLRSAPGQFQTLALGDEKVSKAIVLKSGLRPGQKHNLTAESAEIDAGVDVARGREWQTVDNYGMDGAVAQ